MLIEDFNILLNEMHKVTVAFKITDKVKASDNDSYLGAMAIKIIEISYMIDGISSTMIKGKWVEEPCKTIETQMQDIFNENDNYKYVDLVYKPNGNTINMRYATLIVDVCDGKKPKTDDSNCTLCGVSNSTLTYEDGQNAGDIAKTQNVTVGELGCRKCGGVVYGAITENKCAWCETKYIE